MRLCGFQDRRRKEADSTTGECGRRRRTASEGDEDVTLKRFKGTGEVDSDGKTDSASMTADCESTVRRGRGMLELVMLRVRDVVGEMVLLTALLTSLLFCRTIPAGLLVSLRRMATPP